MGGSYYVNTLEDEHFAHNHGGLEDQTFLSKWVMAVGSMLNILIFQGVPRCAEWDFGIFT